MTRTTRLAAGCAAGLALTGAGFGLGYSAASLDRRVRPAPPVPAERAPAPPDRAAAPLFEIFGDPDAFSRAARLSALLSKLGPEAVPTVRATLEKPPFSGFGAVEAVLLARFWATHEPAAASEWALGSWPDYRMAISIPVFELFARADPQAVVESLRSKQLVGEWGGVGLQTATVRGWYESGQPGLEDHIRGLGYGITRQRALYTLAREMIRHEGSDATIRWAESLPDGKSGRFLDDDHRFKSEAFLQVTSELAMADPAAAVVWCDAHCDGPFTIGNLRELLAMRWAARDGRAAMEWLSALPPGKERDLAVRNSARAWWKNDRQGLSDYVAERAQTGIGSWFQPALVKWVFWAAGQGDHEAAIQAALLIEDDLKRERGLVRTARSWRVQDQNAADAWLDQSPLSEEVRTRARTPAPKKSPKKSPKQPEQKRTTAPSSPTPAAP